MQRLKDYIGFAAWHSAFVYAGLWTIAYWGLRTGPMVFGGSGACHIDYAPVLFYWNCEGGAPIALLAQTINWALTCTVWAPVYVAAAFAGTSAGGLAAAIVSVHLVGLPAALLIAVRLLQILLDSVIALVCRRPAGKREPSASARALARALQAPRPRPRVPPRETFGLRGPILLEMPAPPLLE